MKKLIFVFCVLAAMSLTSCGNKTEREVSAQDSDTVVLDSITDSIAVDSVQ